MLHVVAGYVKTAAIRSAHSIMRRSSNGAMQKCRSPIGDTSRWHDDASFQAKQMLRTCTCTLDCDRPRPRQARRKRSHLSSVALHVDLRYYVILMPAHQIPRTWGECTSQRTLSSVYLVKSNTKIEFLYEVATEFLYSKLTFSQPGTRG